MRSYVGIFIHWPVSNLKSVILSLCFIKIISLLKLHKGTFSFERLLMKAGGFVLISYGFKLENLLLGKPPVRSILVWSHCVYLYPYYNILHYISWASLQVDRTDIQVLIHIHIHILPYHLPLSLSLSLSGFYLEVPHAWYCNIGSIADADNIRTTTHYIYQAKLQFTNISYLICDRFSEIMRKKLDLKSHSSVIETKDKNKNWQFV